MYVLGLHKHCFCAKTGCTGMVVVYRFHQTALHSPAGRECLGAWMVTDSPAFRERPLLHKLSLVPAVLLVTPKRDILKTPNSGFASSGDLSCVGGSCVQTGSAFFSSGAQLPRMTKTEKEE